MYRQHEAATVTQELFLGGQYKNRKIRDSINKSKIINHSNLLPPEHIKLSQHRRKNY